MSGAWIAAFLALWALVVLLGLLVLGTLRRIAPILERAEAHLSGSFAGGIAGGLPPGTPVPDFEAEDTQGDRFTGADLRGASSILLFLSAGCGPCRLFVDDLSGGNVPELGARLIVVTDRSEARALDRSPEVTVLAQEARELSHVFESKATPHAFAIDERGIVVAKGTPNDWERLRELIAPMRKGGDRSREVAAAVVE